MSYNRNIYNNRHNELTFRNFVPHHFVAPPPPPPMFFSHPMEAPLKISDQDFVKKFEENLKNPTKLPKPITITEVREKVKEMVVNLNLLKDKEKELSENMSSCTDEEWQSILEEVQVRKSVISNCLANINDTHLDVLRKLLAKRASKRLRLKRLRTERKMEKEEKIKKMEEKSRKIDENLQKIKDDISKAKQEEEAKLQADIVLKEVLRKKHDAKKCILKLHTLKRLRKARLNTAKGRGQPVSQQETEEFEKKIENLKSLWAQKLITYEEEEQVLRNKLKDNSQDEDVTDSEKDIASNLLQWKEVLFGDKHLLPQVDFNGDLDRFIAVRWQWDQFVSNDGASLPVGWVTPVKSPN